MIYQGNTPDAYEHFKLVREDGAYRNFLMLEEMRAEMESIWGRPEIEEAPIISHQDTRQLNNELERMKGKMVWLTNKLNEHLDRGKRKQGKDFL